MVGSPFAERMSTMVAASLASPRALGWREDLSRLRPLTRQVFRVDDPGEEERHIRARRASE
jgi:hypothetical protein